MALFKAKALPVVIHDIASSIDRASRNSVRASTLLHDFVRIDPPNVNIDALLSGLSRDVFRLREDAYPAKEVVGAFEKLGVRTNVGSSDCGYWSIYAYLYSLLPVLVERPRVGGSRWTVAEYRQLEAACFSRWCNSHEQNDDLAFMSGYNRVRTASKAWFGRESKLTAAIDSCACNAADDIVRSFPQQQGAAREKGFRFTTEELIDSLLSAFKADLAHYYLIAGGFHFFASDSAPLPSHIDKQSGWP